MVLTRWAIKALYRGPAWTLRAIRSRLRPYRMRVDVPIGGRALEIGGPSIIFDPIYGRFDSVDNVQFAAETSHQGRVEEGEAFLSGHQYVREATVLTGLGPYDVVLASHILEHTADPLAALTEWRRVLRPGGHLIVVTPDPAQMFDHRRPITTLDHLRGDRGRGEDDMTHLPEVLALDDRKRSDIPTMARADMEPLWRDNHRTRALHHHVFDADLLEVALHEAGFSAVDGQRVWPYHTVAIARCGPT